MPNYQRLDLSFNYYRHKKNGRMGIWNLSIYNAYAHHNSFMILPSEEFRAEPHNVWGGGIWRPVTPHTRATAYSL